MQPEQAERIAARTDPRPLQRSPAVTDRPQAARPTNPACFSDSSQPASRREFLTGSTAALAGASAVMASGLALPMVHAGGSSTIKIGLVGCGGRGSGAAE